jgi:glycosyltransferase involved in cell wall biosynthesis
MRLLIFTQKMDSKDPILGFFCRWVAELSMQFEFIHVVCLEAGQYDLPSNVMTYSLGKEKGATRFQYIMHFYRYLSALRGKYDKVFVHMNQEYVLLGGVCWKISGIPVYLWRNHPYGNLTTRIAVFLSTKVFCTSRQSFTAQFKKTVIMPAGIDTDKFKPDSRILRKKNSVCIIGRIAPIKGVELALQSVKQLIDWGTQVSLSIVGSPLETDRKYDDDLKNYALNNRMSSYVQFVDAVPPEKMPEIYCSHEICLNFTVSGSFDKTIVEAAACGTIPIVSNQSLRGILPIDCITERKPEIIANSIKNILNTAVRSETLEALEKFTKGQSLSELMQKLIKEI